MGVFNCLPSIAFIQLPSFNCLQNARSSKRIVSARDLEKGWMSSSSFPLFFLSGLTLYDSFIRYLSPAYADAP